MSIAVSRQWDSEEKSKLLESDDEDHDARPNPSLPPWLGLRARISLSWVSYSFFPIITLFLSLCLLEMQLSNLMIDGQKSIQAACSGVDQVGSYAVSLPHYLATGTNLAISDSVAGVLNHAASGLDLTISALEGALDFIINAYLGPFLCLLAFVVQAAVAVIAAALALVDDAVNAAAGPIISAIEDAASGYNKIAGEWNSHASVSILGHKIGVTVPTISVSNTSISPVHLDLADDLTSAANGIPTPAAVAAKLTALINAPLEDLKTLISTLIGKIDVGFDAFPIPDMDSVSFCSGANQQFLTTVEKDLQTVIRWVMYGLAVAAFFLFVLLAARAWWEYKLRLAYVESVRQSFFPQDDPHPTPPTTSQLLAFYEVSKNPAFSLALNAQSKDPNRTWFLTFITHPPVLAFFFIGAIGFLVVEAQLLVTSSGLRQYAEALILEALHDFAQDIKDAINVHLNATSTSYASGVNGVIGGISNDWDSTIGQAIQSFTLFMNTTVVDVYNEITAIVTDIFGTGPYAADVNELVTCIIGSKLTMLEVALSFVNNNSILTFPQMSDNVFLISSDQTNDIVSTAVGNGTNSTLGQSMSTFIDRYDQTLVYSGWLYLIYLGIVLIVFVMGTVGVLHGGNTDNGDEDDQVPLKKSRSTKGNLSSIPKKRLMRRSLGLNDADGWHEKSFESRSGWSEDDSDDSLFFWYPDILKHP